MQNKDMPINLNIKLEKCGIAFELYAKKKFYLLNCYDKCKVTK